MSSDVPQTSKGGSQKVKPEDCPKLDECYKLKMILDKDLLDFQYAEAIRAVCASCSGSKQYEMLSTKERG